MTSRNEVTEIRERFAGETGDEAMAPAPARWIKVFGAFAALFVAAIAAGLVLSGCGASEDSGTRTETSAQVEGQEAVTHAQVASAVGTPAPAQPGLSAEEMATREGLPPDLEVTVGDTLVAPGEVVDFTVEGTDDVSQIALSDGRDEPLPFVRDQGTNLWHVQYRVPLRPKQDRIGVSVTAKNDLARWRRVWVFLHVEEKADSTEGCQIPADNPDELVHGK
jgi:hypothetical protein